MPWAEHVVYTKEEAISEGVSFVYWKEGNPLQWCLTDDDHVAELLRINGPYLDRRRSKSAGSEVWVEERYFIFGRFMTHGQCRVEDAAKNGFRVWHGQRLSQRKRWKRLVDELGYTRLGIRLSYQGLESVGSLVVRLFVEGRWNRYTQYAVACFLSPGLFSNERRLRKLQTVLSNSSMVDYMNQEMKQALTDAGVSLSDIIRMNMEVYRGALDKRDFGTAWRVAHELLELFSGQPGTMKGEGLYTDYADAYQAQVSIHVPHPDVSLKVPSPRSQHTGEEWEQAVNGVDNGVD